ncbi:MAG: nucleotidyltransferase [Spirochaetes bacterium]|nr:nucleotidyltransferase [Spirochaetota bacterium]
MHKDFLEFIAALNRNNVDFVIIGGVALAYYGHPRYTGDLDLWIYPSEDNVKKTFRTIEKFFSSSVTITPRDFLSGKNMVTLGEEPVQIQIHLHLDGVSTQEIWDNSIIGKFGKHKARYIGKETFIKNKSAVGRTQDLADIEKIRDR